MHLHIMSCTLDVGIKSPAGATPKISGWLRTHHLISGWGGGGVGLKKNSLSPKVRKKSLLKMWAEKKSLLSNLMKNMSTRKNTKW